MRFDVAVLFARRTSVYFDLAVDVYDERRDARTFRGGRPVVAHPPCRAWGRLRRFAKPLPHERELALFAVEAVRANGGVLEHPAGSALWEAAGLPRPGAYDDFGGFALRVLQSWFGRRAPKATWLYVYGCDRDSVPEWPTERQVGVGRVERMCRAERERTPLPFAVWLCELAEACR